MTLDSDPCQSIPLRSEDLRVFEVVVRCGSLHAAKEELELSQPALSKAVQRLEQRFGVRLLDRSPRGVTPTAYGRTLYERAKEVGLLMDDTLKEIDDMHAGHQGLVRFGVIPSMAEWATDALSAVIQTRPMVTFQISVQLSDVLIQHLRAGSLDLILAATPQTLPDDLNQQFLWTQRHFIVARAGHPLLQSKVLQLSSLEKEKWLLPVAQVTTRQWIDLLFSEAGLSAPDVQLEIDASPVYFSKLIRNSNLVTAMSENLLASLSGEGLAPLHIEDVEWSHQLQLAWRRTAYMSRAVADLREHLFDLAGKRSSKAP